MSRKMHVIDPTDAGSATCKNCGRLIIKSKALNAPLFVTNMPDYIQLPVEARCSPETYEGKSISLSGNTWR